MRKTKDDGGAAAVELALVLPILLTLVFGIIEFGFAFNRYITVTHAAREGVRVYALSGDALEGETAGEAAAPDLAGNVACTGSASSLDQVQMVCSTTFDLNMLVITAPLDLTSTARMRRE